MTPANVKLDWLKQWNHYAPQSIALQDGETGRAITYAGLYRQSQRLAAHLQTHFRITAGDRVVCVAQNELEYVSLFFATQRLGAILVPVNFRFKPAEVEHIVKDSGARLLIAQEPFLTELRSLKSLAPAWSFEDLQETATDSTASMEDIEFSSSAEDICMILYTSGTTGFPKGAMISHRMLFWNSINTGLRLNLTQSDCVITFLPLFHTGGWNVLTTPCLHRGAKVILLKKFEADRILRLCEQEKVSVLFGVPTTMGLLQTCPLFGESDLSSIRYAIVGGEPMPIELIKTWEARGIPVRQGYGLTEFGPNVFSLSEADSLRKIGSIGFPNFYIQARIVDEHGQDCPPDEIGELVLSGPVAMSGYWNNPDATAAILKEGWLHTGDLARRDAEGYFFVVGRQKDMFISGGENVYPAEVERVLREITDVSEVAVIGVPHEKWGECGKAFIVAKSGSSLDIEILRRHCTERLAKFKIPQFFLFLDALPKTESGKIAKKLL